MNLAEKQLSYPSWDAKPNLPGSMGGHDAYVKKAGIDVFDFVQDGFDEASLFRFPHENPPRLRSAQGSREATSQTARLQDALDVFMQALPYASGLAAVGAVVLLIERAQNGGFIYAFPAIFALVGFTAVSVISRAVNLRVRKQR